MMKSEFLNLLPPDVARERFLSAIHRAPNEEIVDTSTALGRINTRPVLADRPLPDFSRSTVDGYATRAEDTYGASESLPAYLQITGEVLMGSSPEMEVEKGQCAIIHTGGMIPRGANAVVMLEHAQAFESELEVYRSVASGENVIQVGEDVKAGELLIYPGTRLRPAEIGGLMALGITRIEVARKPKVGIISTGDEVVSPESVPLPGQVRDVNAFSLSALIEQAGGAPVRYGIVPDDLEVLQDSVNQAFVANDLIIITAGSSASVRDYSAQAINKLGSPGVIVHGVNIRPGKPTILGVCDGKPVIGLPGNPISALVIGKLFVVPVIEALLGAGSQRQRINMTARLSANLPSQAGREDWIAVRILPGEKLGEFVAEPIFTKSNLIFGLVRADGLVRIPAESNGMSARDIVEVWIL